MRAAYRPLIAGLALLAAGLGAVVAPGQTGARGEKHALLIGVSKYPKGKLRSLQYPDADVEGMARALVKAGYRQANIHVMTQKARRADPSRNPTLANIRATLQRWLKNRTDSDTLLIAFAGHGVQFRGSNVQFLCPADANLKDPQNTLLRVDEVYQQLQRSRAGFRLLLADACRNDPSVDLSRSAAPGEEDPPVVKIQGGLRPDVATKGGAVALFSCSQGEKAYEHDGLKHSVFYHFVIKGLGGEADSNKDGKVTLAELLEYVQDHVSRFTQREFFVQQMPELHGNLRGSVALATVQRPTVPVPLPPTRSNPIPPDQRLALVRELTGHDKRVWAVAVAPSGRLVATAGGDQTIRLWDPASGETTRTLTGHSGEVHSVAFSAGGTQLLSGGQDRTARIWDVAGGRELGRLSGHTGAVTSVALSLNGKWAATGGGDQQVILWNLAKFKEYKRFPGHAGLVTSVAVSPDCWRVLSGATDGTVRYWPVAKGQQGWVAAHAKVVYGVAISNDGRRGLSGSADRTMRLWDLESGVELHRFPHPDEVNGVAFSPDGRFALSGCDDGNVRLWDVRSGRLLRVGWGHRQLVYHVAFAGNGRVAASAAFDKTARVWDLGGVTSPAVPAKDLPPRLAARADLQVSVSWDNASDVDLHVTEPDGTVCYYGKKLTPRGGQLLHDVQNGLTGPEQYQAVKAQPGIYKIKLQYYTGPLKDQKGPTRVTVVVHRFAGTPHAKTYRYHFNLTKKGEVVNVCTVAYTGRTAALEGSWTTASLTTAGKTITDAALRQYWMIFRGQQVTLATPGKSQEGTFAITPLRPATAGLRQGASLA
jgi:WD40 repeat protein